MDYGNWILEEILEEKWGRGRRGSGMLHDIWLTVGSRAAMACIGSECCDILAWHCGRDGRAREVAINATYVLELNILCFLGGVIQNLSGEAFWSEASKGDCKSLVRFVRVFSGKTVTTMKSTVLLACPVHIATLNSSAVYQQCLLENGLTSLGCFPSKMKPCKESDLIGKGKAECAQ